MINNYENLLSLQTRLEAKTELLRRGLHLFKYYDKQQQFADSINIFGKSKQDTFVYGGAMGGGKTYVCIGLLIELALLYPGSKWTVLRESLQRCRDTVASDFKIIGKGLYEKFNEASLIAAFHNGSIIEFKGENISQDPELDAFKSYRTNGFFIEQVEEIQQKTYEMCLIRTGRHRIDPMPPQVMLLSINPTQDWPKEKFYEPYRKKELESNIYYQPALIQDNPTLRDDPAYMDRLNNLDPLTYKKMIEGDWYAYSRENLYTYCWDQKFIREREVNPNGIYYLSFDFNVNPMTCIVCQHDRLYKWINVIEEFRLTDATIYDLCDRIKAKYNPAQIKVTGDPRGTARHSLAMSSNLNHYSVILQQLGLSENQLDLPGKFPAPVEEHDMLRLISNSIFSKYKEVNINKNCVHLINDFQYISVKNGKREKTKEGVNGHLLDCFLYYLYTYFNDFVSK